MAIAGHPPPRGLPRPVTVQPLGIERHGHQASALRINQVPRGRIAGLRGPLDQVSPFARPDRLDGNLRVGESDCSSSGSKEHCLAAGQELRPAVADLPFLETSQRLRGASCVRHLLES